LFSLADLAEAWTPFELFDRPLELEIEVGSGKGLFLCSAASEHPERHFVGIEIAGKYANYTAARLARHGLPNAKMIHGDAMRLFADLPPARIAAVHVYFPDPWWKRKHHKRRIMNGTFLGHVERVLRPGGDLHFWTDVQEYFQTTIEQIRTSTQLDGPYDVEVMPAEHDFDYHTHFERRMQLHDHPVHRSRFQKLSTESS